MRLSPVIVGVFLAVVALAIVLMFCGNKYSNSYYPYQKTYPFLNTLQENHEAFKKEVIYLQSTPWKSWPGNENESIYPLYGNGYWVESHCNECPNLYHAISTMPRLKTAYFSKREKQERTIPASTYAFIGNKTLRCMYCFTGSGKINVEGEERAIHEKEILVYDHAKQNSFQNDHKTPQIVLILDFTRPSWVKEGNSSNLKGLSFMGHSF